MGFLVVPKVKRTREVHPQVKITSRQLFTYYYDALRTTQLSIDPRRFGAVGVTFEPSFDDADVGTKRVFRRAAETALQIAADPREFVVAQFKRWAEVSQLKGKFLLPQPYHLATIGAQARYVQYRLQKQARIERSAVNVETQHRDHYVEERKLKGMVRMFRVLEEDVLTEKPEEFSKSFLKYKQVWPLVKDLWHERRA